MAERDLYEVLGVARDATDEELKRAYRKQGPRAAPRHQPRRPRRRGRVQAGHRRLRGAVGPRAPPPVRPVRAAGAHGRPAAARSGRPSARAASATCSRRSSARWAATRRAARRARCPGPTPRSRLRLTLAEAAFGAHAVARGPPPGRAATACGATGAAPGTTAATLRRTARATGELRRVRQSILGQMVTSSPCPRCQATGSTIASPCSTCRGEGRTTASVDAHRRRARRRRGRLHDAARGPGRRGVPRRAERDAVRAPRRRARRALRAPRRRPAHRRARSRSPRPRSARPSRSPTLEGDETIDVERGTQPGAVHPAAPARRDAPARPRPRRPARARRRSTCPTELDEESETLLRSLAEHRGEEVARAPHGAVLEAALATVSDAARRARTPRPRCSSTTSTPRRSTTATRHHLARVLRLRDGERVVACDGAGRVAAVRVRRRDGASSRWATSSSSRRRARAGRRCGSRRSRATARSGRSPKLTELGVDEIGLLACERASVRLDADRAARVLARWRRVAREATCQSRRTRLPELSGPLDVGAVAGAGAVRCDLDGDARRRRAARARRRARGRVGRRRAARAPRGRRRSPTRCCAPRPPRSSPASLRRRAVAARPRAREAQ